MQEELKAMPVMKSLNEAEKLSGMPYTTLRKLCMAGKIVHIRLGSKYMINWNKFVEYLNNGDGPEESADLDVEQEEVGKEVIHCACCGKELEPFYGDAQLKYSVPEMDLSIDLCIDCMNEISYGSLKWSEDKIKTVWEQFQKKIAGCFKV